MIAFPSLFLHILISPFKTKAPPSLSHRRRPPFISCGPRASCALIIPSAQDARGPKEYDHDSERARRPAVR
jgi:hypothetical protein